MRNTTRQALKTHKPLPTAAAARQAYALRGDPTPRMNQHEWPGQRASPKPRAGPRRQRAKTTKTTGRQPGTKAQTGGKARGPKPKKREAPKTEPGQKPAKAGRLIS